jgi:hypothetical protein
MCSKWDICLNLEKDWYDFKEGLCTYVCFSNMCSVVSRINNRY